MSKIRFLVGFQKGRSGPRVACYCNWPPGNLWLRLLLRHFRHEIRWCFGFGYVSKKVSGCWFLALEAAAGVRISSRSSEGTFRPPGNLLLRRILRHFRHEIRWCFGFGYVSKKVSGCWFLALEAAAGVRISSRSSEGTFRPPGNLLLRRILRHFWHEIRWCFAVSAVFRKRCLQQQQEQQQPAASSSQSQ